MRTLKTYGNKGLWERIKSKLIIRSGWKEIIPSINLKVYDTNEEEL